MKILVIQGNPIKNSFGHKLAEAYAKGANASGAEATLIDLIDLKFDPNLNKGYGGLQELEPDLEKAQKLIKSADHLVFFFPSWWASFPALLKGFIDRVFLPGFAFRYNANSPLPEKILTGKSARLVITMDAPVSWYIFFNKQPGVNILKKGILEFCGVKPVKTTLIGGVRTMAEEERNKWVKKISVMGSKRS